MLRYLALFALLGPSAVIAQPASQPLIETRYDDIPFAYRSELRPDGYVEINGRMLDTNDLFRLVVKPNGRVIGRVGGNSVRFAVSGKVRDRLVTGLRARPAPAPVAVEFGDIVVKRSLNIHSGSGTKRSNSQSWKAWTGRRNSDAGVHANQ